MQFILNSHTLENTQNLAAKIAPFLYAGDVLCLQGDIGAGKTEFIRKIIQNRMIDADMFEDVPSPTFTLVQNYQIKDTEYTHADLYRVNDVEELGELDIARAFEETVCFVEWPDRATALMPDDALTVQVSVASNETRSFKFLWTHQKWSDRLAHIFD